jgi:type VI secretion system protein ImpB
MSESTQKKLSRVRPPRVQITYDVETGGAIEEKELPFAVNIMADLSGQPEEPLAPLKARKFVSIDRDNFDDVLGSIRPRVAVRVDNKLADDDSQLNVELKFEKFSDFAPENLVHQVEPLKRLIAARERLTDLLAKLNGNDELAEILRQVAEDPTSLESVQHEIKRGSDDEQDQ